MNRRGEWGQNLAPKLTIQDPDDQTSTTKAPRQKRGRNEAPKPPLTAPPGSTVDETNSLNEVTQVRKKMRISKAPVMESQNTPSRSQSLVSSGHEKEVVFGDSGEAVSKGQSSFIPGEFKGANDHQNPPKKIGRSAAEPGIVSIPQRAENLDSLRDKKGVIQGRAEHVIPVKRLRDNDMKVRLNLLEKGRQEGNNKRGKVKPAGHSCVESTERNPSHSPEEGKD